MLSNIILQVATAAQTATEVAPQAVATTEKLNIFSLAVKGGWIMIVLGILSIIAVYIFVDRLLALNKALKEDTSFMNNVKNCIHNNDLQGAKNLCASNNSPIGRMISKGISRLGRPLNDINQAVENVGNLEISKLESGVSMIATISNLAPSLGFLGTVTGMVKAFFNMSQAGNNIDIQLLSSGIYEAMVTTVGGLIVGIIASFLYSILAGKINKIVFILEARTMEFMDLLHEPA